MSTPLFCSTRRRPKHDREVGLEDRTKFDSVPEVLLSRILDQMTMTEDSNYAHDSRALLKVDYVAEFLGISERYVWKLNSSGRLPLPVRLGGATRWVRSELLAWIDAGCPGRSKWETMKSQALAKRR